MIMRSKTSWIFDVCGTGFPETRLSDLPTSRIASRPDCQRDGKRSAGFIPTAPSGSSIHYSLSTAFHYSLKRNSLSPTPPHTIICNTTIFNDVHTRWLLGCWCEKYVVPYAQGAVDNQAVLQSQSPISATAFRNSSIAGTM